MTFGNPITEKRKEQHIRKNPFAGNEEERLTRP